MVATPYVGRVSWAYRAPEPRQARSVNAKLSVVAELSELIPSGENNYVVVMTFGYRTDDMAVRALLQKQFKYFGLLGSKKKIEKMFAEYKNEGMDEGLLDKIYSPIGLQIKSETPEEIAVSIAAEIIKVKNDR